MERHMWRRNGIYLGCQAWPHVAGVVEDKVPESGRREQEAELSEVPSGPKHPADKFKLA